MRLLTPHEELVLLLVDRGDPYRKAEHRPTRKAVLKRLGRIGLIERVDDGWALTAWGRAHVAAIHLPSRQAVAA